MKVSCVTVTFVAVVVLMATLALINNMRWSYYGDGTLMLDRWTGRLIGYGEDPRPRPLLGTAGIVLGLAGGAAGFVAMIMATHRLAKERGDRTR
jgi:hypothetical protein